MEPENTTAPEKKRTKSIIWAVSLLFLFFVGYGLIKPIPKGYSFVSADHPIDMWRDGKDQWAYYSLDTLGQSEHPTDDLAEVARKELIPLGFTEDKSKAPWFRFVKDNNEVVVCNHSEFAVNSSFAGGKLVQTSSMSKVPGSSPVKAQQWPCALLKNGPVAGVSLPFFTVKKILLRW